MPKLLEELKAMANDKTPQSRGDLRATARFFAANPAIAVLVAFVCGAGGMASVLDWLKPAPPLLRWGLAVLLWGFAIFALVAARRGKREV